jgi:hypothetical protein
MSNLTTGRTGEQPLLRARWPILALLLVAASAVALRLIAPPMDLPSYLRDPLWTFVQPGTTVWWLTWGGPFRTGPTSAAGLAFTAIANGVLWLMFLWIGTVIVRIVRCIGRALHGV